MYRLSKPVTIGRVTEEASIAALERHSTAMATVVAFARGSGAQQVLVLADRGDDATPTLLEWRAGEPLELTDEGLTWEVPDELAEGGVPLPLPPLRPVPASALRVDIEAGTVEGPPGAVLLLAEEVRALAEAFGGLSVASADWATAESGPAFTIAARPGEPPVLGVGDELFEMPAA